MSPRISPGSRLMYMADILLEIHRLVSVEAVRVALTSFRQWNNGLARKPLLVDDYSLSVEDTLELLVRKVGLPQTIAARLCDLFAREPAGVNTWSRARGIPPGRRIDALELFAGLTLTSRGTLRDILALLFLLFDVSGSGFIGEDDLGALLASCASVLRRLGLAPSLSADEVTFAAGSAFSTPREGSNGAEFHGPGNHALAGGRLERSSGAMPDTMDCAAFLEWARAADLVAYAFRALSVAHRLSRVVDGALGIVDIFRERYSSSVTAARGKAFQAGPGTRTAIVSLGVLVESTAVASREYLRYNHRTQPGLKSHSREMSAAKLRFALPPIISSVGFNQITVALEVGRGIMEDTRRSSCHLVALVEEQRQARFCLVAADKVILKEDVPAALSVSGLKAGTCYRFRLELKAVIGDDRAQLETESSGRSLANDGIFRFRTLGISSNGRQAVPCFPMDNGSTRTPSERPRVEVIRESDRVVEDEASLEPSSSTGMSDGSVVKADSGVAEPDSGHVEPASALIEPGSDRTEPGSVRTELGSGRIEPASDPPEPGSGLVEPDSNIVVRQGEVTCWGAARASCTGVPPTRSTARGDVLGRIGCSRSVLVQEWPPQSRPRGKGRDPMEDFPSVFDSSLAPPFFGMDLRGMPAGTSGSIHIEEGCYREDVDLVVHMSPRWHAEEVLRRCFARLEDARYGIPAAEEEAKLAVHREVFDATRSLLSGTCSRGGRSPEGANREAHVILGRIDPWLGLEKAEVESHGEDLRLFVGSVVRSALRSYVWDRGMCGGTAPIASPKGGTMAVGLNCFLVRPGQEQGGDDDSSSRSRGNGASGNEVEGRTTGNGDDASRSGANSPVGDQEEEDVRPQPDKRVESSERDSTIPETGECDSVGRLHGGGVGRDSARICPAVRVKDGRAGLAAATGSGNRGRIGAWTLYHLMRRMDRIAERLSAQSRAISGLEDGGITAVILLDSPLLPDKHPSTVSTRVGRCSAAGNERHPEEAAVAIEGTSDCRGILGGRGDGGSRSENEENTENAVNAENTENTENTENAENPEDTENAENIEDTENAENTENTDNAENVDDVENTEDTDNAENALEALLSWARGGSVQGRRRRNVVVVCGPGAIDEHSSVEGPPAVTPAGGDQNAKEEEEVRGIAIRAIGDGEGVRHEVERGTKDEHDGPGEATVMSRETEDGSDVIRQITLEGMEYASLGFLTPPIPRAQDRSAFEIGHPHQIDRLEGGSAMGLDASGRNSGGSLEIATLRSGPHRHPSQVLLRVRQDSGGENRVLALFPAHQAAIAATESRMSAGYPLTVSHRSGAQASSGDDSKESDDAVLDREKGVVRVVVGPIIGRVTPNSALVLVEFDNLGGGGENETKAGDALAPTESVAVVLREVLSGRSFKTVGGVRSGSSCSCCRVFAFEGLNPGRRYMVDMEGIRSRDQLLRRGSFWTPDITGFLPMWAFTPSSCPASALEELLADMQTTRPSGRVAICVGPVVESTRATRVLYAMLVSGRVGDASGTPDKASRRRRDPSMIYETALSLYRQLYRDRWNEPGMRKVLANCPTVMCGGAGALLLPLVRSFPSGWTPATGSSRDREGGGDETTASPDGATGRSRRRPARGRCAIGDDFDIHWLAGALRAVARAALRVSMEYEDALWRGRERTSRQLAEGDVADDGDSAGMDRLDLLPRFRQWGPIGLLYVTGISSQVDVALGLKGAGESLLSAEAWAWLREFLRESEGCLQSGVEDELNTLIVVTDCPLVWRSATVVRSMGCPTQRVQRGNNGDGDQLKAIPAVGGSRREGKTKAEVSTRKTPCRGQPPCFPSWETHPRDAADLLALLFDWAARGGGDSTPDARGGGDASRGGRRRRGRVFTIVCPSSYCVPVNVRTYVKDAGTGRVAVQWSLAARGGGDDGTEIPMPGCVGPRCSFTHYPQRAKGDGPGLTLIRAIPEPSAPAVAFSGLSTAAEGGAGLALGTVGPIIGDVGTSSATVLVEVSVPMELTLLVKEVGSSTKLARDRGGPGGVRWQRLKKLVPFAHRPVTFCVDNLEPDTRYTLEVSPLGNAKEFRGSFMTRALRPFSFRLAAVAGSRNPFGFAMVQEASSSARHRDPGDGLQAPSGGATRWPFCVFDARSSGPRGDSPVEEASVETGERCHGASGRRWAGEGGGCGGSAWRDPQSIAAAVGFVTDGATLKEMDMERILEQRSDIGSWCESTCGMSAWKVLAEQVEPPKPGLDLIIHLGNEINAPSCFGEGEVQEALQNAGSPRSDSSPGALADTGTGFTLPSLVRPPLLPIPRGLGSKDEEDIAKVEAFLTKVHDEAERSRKLGDEESGGTDDTTTDGRGGVPRRPRPVPAPDLDIILPEESGGGSGVLGAGNRGNPGAAGIDVLPAPDDTLEARRVYDPWTATAQEVAERVRDAYRIAWGMPWVKTVMAATPNAMLAFTPLDLDDGHHLDPLRSVSPGPDQHGARLVEGVSDLRGVHPLSPASLRGESIKAWSDYQMSLSQDRAGARAGEGQDEENGNQRNASDGERDEKRSKDRGAYREYGGIGVLMLDVWANQGWRLDDPGVSSSAGGDGEPGFHPRPLLSKTQRKLVRKALASKAVNALVVCSGTPMVAEPIVHPKAPPLSPEEQAERGRVLKSTKKQLKKLGKAGEAEIRKLEEKEKAPRLALLSPDEVGPMDPFYDESRPCFQWSYHSSYLQELLEKLFDWAAQGLHPTKGGRTRRREVVLLCGGTGCGVRTTIYDRRTGLSMTQICAGRISDPTTPCSWTLDKGYLGERIEFSHEPLVAPAEGSRIFDREESSRSRGMKADVVSRDMTTSRSAVNVQGAEGSRSGHSRDGDTDPGPKSESTLVGVADGERRDDGPSRRTVATTRGATPPNGGPRGDGDDPGAPVAFDLPEGVSGEGRGAMPQAVRHNRNRPSYGLVTVTSEPLNALIDARLVQPPVSSVPGIRRFRKDARKDTNKPTEEGHNDIFPGGGGTLASRTMAAIPSTRPDPLGERKGQTILEGASGESQTREEESPVCAEPVARAILGPVVGKVEVFKMPGELWQSCTVPVLLEVDERAAVVCVVDLSNAFEDGAYFLESLQTEAEGCESGEVLSEEDEVLAMEAVKERFREEYRKVWNQPSTRRVLGSCQHIMMWGCGECRWGYGRQRHAAVNTWAGRRLLRLAKEVFREYQRQLWDPRWGAKFKVADHEGFFTTFRGGSVGILALDALELDAAVVEEGTDVQGTKGGISKGGDGGQNRNKETEEDPVLGRRQWEMLEGVLDCETQLVTLIVATELPVVWHDTKSCAFKLQDPGPARVDLEDHWVAHPAQQRRLLERLFAWKAEKEGREVVLLAGAGKREGSMAAETVLEVRMPQSPPAPTALPKETSGGQGGGSANGGESGVATGKTMGISQITCGPITAEPLDSSDVVKLSTKGKVFVPQSEAEKAERRRKAKGTSSATSSEGSAVDFVHLTKPGRNYLVLQVIAETDEEGPIGVVDPAWATSSSLEKAYPSQEFDRPPSWWTKRCPGDRRDQGTE